MTQSNANKNRSITRRKFIQGSSLVAGSLALGPVLLNACSTAPVTTTATVTTTVSPPETEVYVFFNHLQSETVKAVFSRLIPGDEQDPGAVQAQAQIYLDRSLSGHYLSLQTTYVRGLASLNEYSSNLFGSNFKDLSDSQKDQVLADMQENKATGFNAPPALEFFNLLLAHAREGTFCDPVYGGNKDAVGWKMIGYPGAQVGYTDQDLSVGSDQADKGILTLVDLAPVQVRRPDSGF